MGRAAARGGARFPTLQDVIEPVPVSRYF